MKKVLLLLAAMLVLGTSTASAQDPQFFDFNAQALLPTMVGNDLTLYGTIVNAGQVETPIVLDEANFEYTIVITGLTWNVDAFTQEYGDGTIVIYEDNATAADYASPGTFSDGTAILIGSIPSLNRTMFTANLGNVTGEVDWTGGTRLGEIPAGQQLDWAILSGISNRSTVTEPGYDENWDGKVEPATPIPVDQTSWGRVKIGY
jgi:hypothetical protein